MLNALSSLDLTQLTGLAALLLVVLKALDVLGAYIKDRMDVGGPKISCPGLATHGRLIEEIHRMTSDTEAKKLSGQFACQFKSRDEVRDFLELEKKQIEMIQQNIAVSEKVIIELRALASELRLMRKNGNGGKT